MEIGICHTPYCIFHWNNKSFLWTDLTSLKRRERWKSNSERMEESFDNSDDRWARVPLFPLAGPPLLQNEGFAHWQTPTPELSPRWMLLCSTQRPAPKPKLPSTVTQDQFIQMLSFSWLSGLWRWGLCFYPGLFVLLVSDVKCSGTYSSSSQ